MSLLHPLNVNIGLPRADQTIPPQRVLVPPPAVVAQPLQALKVPHVPMGQPARTINPILSDTSPPPPPNIVDGIKQISIQQFATDATKQVISMNRKPADPTVAPNPDQLATQNKLTSLISTVRNLQGLPNGVVADPSAPIAPPLDPALYPNAPPAPTMTSIIEQMSKLIEAVSGLQPQSQGNPPGSTLIFPPGSFLPLSPTSASIPSTVVATTPARFRPGAPTQTIYEKFNISPISLGLGQYGVREMRKYIDAINAIEYQGQRLYRLNVSGSKDTMRENLLKFFDTHKDDARLYASPSSASSSSAAAPGGPVLTNAPPSPSIPTFLNVPATPPRPTLTQPPSAPVKPPGPPSTFQRKGTGVGAAKWQQFAPSYYLNVPKLGQGVLSISRERHGKLYKQTGFKNRKITQPFREALQTLLSTQRLPDLSELDPADRDYLYDILAIAQPPLAADALSERQKERIKATRAALKKYSNDQTVKSKLTTASQRLQVLLGEVRAGNRNSPAIAKEGNRILNQLVRHSIITRADAEKLQKLLV